MQKFSSNVIEKCLEKADIKTRNQFFEQMAISDKLASNFHSLSYRCCEELVWELCGAEGAEVGHGEGQDELDQCHSEGAPFDSGQKDKKQVGADTD